MEEKKAKFWGIKLPKYPRNLKGGIHNMDREQFAINIGKEKLNKVNKFFVDFNIKNFEPYFDPPTTLAKKFCFSSCL